MQRTIQVANVQMDICPAPTDERLYRADQLIFDAVQTGAELVVLPELFNTGYSYSDENDHRAEPVDGATIHWMQRTARRQHVHLAGSMLLRENGEIFNAMFIVAPSGQAWRYDKCYPWAWEHAYFRPSLRQGVERAVVAHTDLGDLGMLICWDAAHPELWMAYAGQVDMMVICSSPPHITRSILTLPSGASIHADRLGILSQQIQDDDLRAFGEMLEEQTAWLQVPVASCMPSGQFKSSLPAAPGLGRLLPQGEITAPVVEANRILSAEGKTLVRGSLSSGECYITTEVWLAENKPQPQARQPKSRLSKTAYYLSNSLLRGLMQPVYQQRAKQRER
jgi:predicted amidohydrolase